jgi:imidazoleglycerol-phosphate dehydratase
MAPRTATITRNTNETKVHCVLNIDGGELDLPAENGSSDSESEEKPKRKHAYQKTKAQHIDIDTGIGFLDHMLHQLAKHGGWSMYVRCVGDLHIDDHHTSEDTFIALGTAFAEALQSTNGLKRFAHAYAPLDEALSRAVVDLSNRPYAVIEMGLKREKLGEWSTEMIKHGLHSFAMHGGITMHVDVIRGENDHHRAESSFKALALALREATSKRAGMEGEVMSSKGVL